MTKYWPIVVPVALSAMLLYVIFLPAKGDGSKKVDEVDAGAVVTIEALSTSWNDVKLTRVETESSVFYVHGIIPIVKGVNARATRYESGLRYLCLADREQCLRVIDNN